MDPWGTAADRRGVKESGAHVTVTLEVPARAAGSARQDLPRTGFGLAALLVTATLLICVGVLLVVAVRLRLSRGSHA